MDKHNKDMVVDAKEDEKFLKSGFGKSLLVTEGAKIEFFPIIKVLIESDPKPVPSSL